MWWSSVEVIGVFKHTVTVAGGYTPPIRTIFAWMLLMRTFVFDIARFLYWMDGPLYVTTTTSIKQHCLSLYPGLGNCRITLGLTQMTIPCQWRMPQFLWWWHSYSLSKQRQMLHAFVERARVVVVMHYYRLLYDAGDSYILQMYFPLARNSIIFRFVRRRHVSLMNKFNVWVHDIILTFQKLFI